MEIKSIIKDICFKAYQKDVAFADFQAFLGSKAAKLFEHEIAIQKKKRQEMEEKPGYWGHYSYANCFFCDVDGLRINLAANNGFIWMTKKQYLESFIKNPDLFGTGDALDVLKALYLNSGFKNTGYCFLRYIDVCLAYETCCYAFFQEDDKYNDDFLRIDLFREIKPSIDNPEKLEFIGGLFHALKHFSYQGRNLSIGNEVGHTEVDYLDDIIKLCIKAFVCKQTEGKGKDYVFDLPLDGGKTLKFVFYKENDSKAFYIKSVHLK